MNNGFTRPERLYLRKEVSEVFKLGTYFSNSILRMMVYYDTDQIKTAVHVSKKIGNAVKRNRAKRVVREAIRLTITMVHKKCYFVVIPKKTLFDVSFQQVQEYLVSLYKQAKLMK